MSKSYKVLLLLAWMDSSRPGSDAEFPGSIAIGRLVEAVRHVASRSAVLRDDLGPAQESDSQLQQHLEVNPIAAWTDGKGTAGVSYFEYRDGRFSTRAMLDLEDPAMRQAFRDWVTELATFRMAEYLGRKVPRPFRAKVSHSSGNPILFLPPRSQRADLPSGWVGVQIEGRRYKANLVRIAINVIQSSDGGANQLPTILRNWFGPGAGTPGRRDQVRFQPLPDGVWEMSPEVAPDGGSQPAV